MKAPLDPADPLGLRLVGDPIDVVTGRVVERTLCFRLIGPLFLEFYRHYDSGCTALSRGFGNGHAHSYDHRLAFDADGLRLEECVGSTIYFPPLNADGDRQTAQGATLIRHSLARYRLARPGRPVVDFTFTDPERPARIARVSRGRAAINFSYDRDGSWIGLTHSTGLAIAVQEDASHRLLSLAGAWDGGGADRPILTCEYDAAGGLIGITDALQRRGTFAYDDAHRLVRRTDRRGYSFLYEFDPAGRCVRAAGEDGVMGVVLRYRTEERITEVTRSDGGVWTYHYDGGGSITHVIGPHGDVRRYIIDADGRTTGEIDPLGNGLDYVFDQTGGLIGKRFGTGRFIPVEAGHEIADPPPHRVAENAWQFLYGNQPSRVVATSEASPPLAPRLARALLPQPPPATPSPDVPPFGSLPWYPPPSSGREFSPFGHLTSQILPDGGRRQWTYDPNDSVYLSRDADGSVVRQERRSWNQLASWVDPLGHETRYRFTTEDQVAAVTDPGGTVTEFAYDKERRLLGVRRAGQVRETYRYDGAGNLIEKRDGDGNTLLTLIPTADRLTVERRLASGGTQSFSYDHAGRIVTATTDFSEVRFAYDAAGRRTADQRDGVGVTHDFAERPGMQTTVLDRFVVRHELTDDELTIHLPNGAWLHLDHSLDLAVRRVCSNGTVELCQFDAMGRLLASTITSERAPQRSWSRRWRYSHEGDLLEVDDDRLGPAVYRYDAAHRLIGRDRPGGRTESYVHDPAGNLTAQPGLSDVVLEQGNRLATANGERFAYDVRQHIAERQSPNGSMRYRYDSRDMLVLAEGPDGAWHAAYDAIGRRTRVWRDGEEHRFFWDTDRLAAEEFPSGQLRIYVYTNRLALTPVAFVDYTDRDADPADGAAYFVFTDQRGAPVLVEDNNGTERWQARLEPYGKATIDSRDGLVLNLRFPGHYFDAVTGLHHNRYRYYDPVLGRYIQSDPMGIGGGVNVYAYSANPLVQVDVRGLTGGTGAACPEGVEPESSEDKDDKEQTSPHTTTADDDLDTKVAQSRAAYARAVAAADGLTGRNADKCVSSDGNLTLSGWSGKPDDFTAVDPMHVIIRSNEIGHILPSSGARDHGTPGQAVASHAEKQQSVLNPNQPQGVNIGMCPNCQEYMSLEAMHSGVPQVVTDPDGTRIFHPNGEVEERGFK